MRDPSRDRTISLISCLNSHGRQITEVDSKNGISVEDGRFRDMSRCEDEASGEI